MLTEARIEQYTSAISRAAVQRQQREQIVQDLNTEITELSVLLGQDEITHSDLLTNSAMSQLSAAVEELREEKKQREEDVRDLARRITPLWDLLQIEAAERHAFFTKNNGLGDAVIKACEEELVRLQSLKVERIASMIAAEERSLEYIWQQLQTGLPVDTVVVDPSSTIVDKDEALLQAYKLKIATVQALLTESQPLRTLAQRRAGIVASITEYQQLLQDPARLMGRKTRDRERQQREEALRKDIETTLPKLESKLVVLLEQWKRDHDTPFMFCADPAVTTNQPADSDLLQCIQNERREQQRIKEDQKRQKAAERLHQAEQQTLHGAATDGSTTARKGSVVSLGGSLLRPKSAKAITAGAATPTTPRRQQVLQTRNF
eukprot:TRINITY_DN3062_c0_g1_i1.p1 TRINITY_DN3062_c0_g1~~TRINITY_DN3062_c0_g1_i1.p1  ORF type:complete len:377 (-),score=133.20 TRINITY_DN3062_c0_g1_i1:247-1377(-)